MRTGRSLTVFRSLLLPGGTCLVPGECTCLVWGVYLPGPGRYTCLVPGEGVPGRGSTCLVPGGVYLPGPGGGLYLPGLGGVPAWSGGCTWSRGCTWSEEGVYLVQGVYLPGPGGVCTCLGGVPAWSGGSVWSGQVLPPREQNECQIRCKNITLAKNSKSQQRCGDSFQRHYEIHKAQNAISIYSQFCFSYFILDKFN